LENGRSVAVEVSVEFVLVDRLQRRSVGQRKKKGKGIEKRTRKGKG
jgi:hypothetical protein